MLVTFVGEANALRMVLKMRSRPMTPSDRLAINNEKAGCDS